MERGRSPAPSVVLEPLEAENLDRTRSGLLCPWRSFDGSQGPQIESVKPPNPHAGRPSFHTPPKKKNIPPGSTEGAPPPPLSPSHGQGGRLVSSAGPGGESVPQRNSVNATGAGRRPNRTWNGVRFQAPANEARRPEVDLAPTKLLPRTTRAGRATRQPPGKATTGGVGKSGRGGCRTRDGRGQSRRRSRGGTTGGRGGAGPRHQVNRRPPPPFTARSIRGQAEPSMPRVLRPERVSRDGQSPPPASRGAQCGPSMEVNAASSSKVRESHCSRT